jgi:acetyltransferase-like isoleucine patch superfamily enzyme
MNSLFIRAEKLIRYLIRRSRYSFFKIDTTMNSPFRVDGSKWIELGSRTSFQRGLWIYCHPSTSEKKKLIIGKNCVFGYNNHIAAMVEISIGDSVLTANNVYISDNIHGYENSEMPIKDQDLVFKGEVKIGNGSWIGENVCIIGASVGKNSVIGANSVVTRNIPDYSVAVGAPAKVIKRYDKIKGIWINVD